jgi:hypothetical protein
MSFISAPVSPRSPQGGCLLFQSSSSLLQSIGRVFLSSKWDMQCAPKLFMETNYVFGGKCPRRSLSTKIIS